MYLDTYHFIKVKDHVIDASQLSKNELSYSMLRKHSQLATFPANIMFCWSQNNQPILFIDLFVIALHY